MKPLIYQIDPRSGNTYVYANEEVIDPVTNRVKCKRVYKGRLNTETGEVYPKGSREKRNRRISDKHKNTISEMAKNKIEDQQEKIRGLEESLEIYKRKASSGEEFADLVRKLTDELGAALTQYEKTIDG